MSAVDDSHPDPELTTRVPEECAGPVRRVSSVEGGAGALVDCPDTNAAPQTAQKRAPSAALAPQAGQSMVRHSTIARMQVDYARARRHLMRADPVLGRLIRTLGPCGLETTRRADRFGMTVLSIVSQQLSVKAASTIHGRMMEALGVKRATPAAILAMEAQRLRDCGLSWAKVASVRDLAAKVSDRSLSLESLDALDDDAVIEALTAVRGIGRWSAEMFLIFRLGRPDILPVGDVGVQRAMRALYGLRKHPSPARMTALARPWRPYRSVACWYLWRSLDD